MGLLDGVRVLDLSNLLAGPTISTILGDHGAEVIKVEPPTGDEERNWGKKKNGIPLWWKVLSRNKRLIAIDLNKPEGQEIVKKMVLNTDILIENFRPGRMEKWGLGWEQLHSLNPRLIMVRVTGFGQKGPYSQFAGFGTLAESMSGFAHVTGQPDGPPTLPAFGLADGIAGITGAFAAVAALFRREKTGIGEMIDVALYEPLMFIVGPHIIQYDQLGIIQQREGNQSSRVCPRNTYLTSDNKWIALSASTESTARRVFQAIGHPELIEDPRFKDNAARLAHRDLVDQIIGDWVRKHTQKEAIDILRSAGAAVAPIYDARDIYEDPHFRERGSIVTVEDPDFGTVTMQGTFPKILLNPAKIKFTGRARIGADTESIMLEMGYTLEQIDELRKKGVIV